MRVLIACDSFKESCAAQVVCASLADGIRRVLPDAVLDLCPLADGGEGTVAAVVWAFSSHAEASAMGARADSGSGAEGCGGVSLEPVTVTGPLGEQIETRIAWTAGDPRESATGSALTRGGRVAWLEAAGCVGLGLVPESRRDPRWTTSYGIGELILHAGRQGADWVVVGLGGTSTVDAGIGMAQALGAAMPGVEARAGGAALSRVRRIELAGLERFPPSMRVVAATDVGSHLLGPRGAARAFGPQKGASPLVVEELESGIASYGRILFESCENQLGGRAGRGSLRAPSATFEAAASQPGAGAAGGLGFALAQLLGAELTSGVRLVMERVGFDRRLALADVVVTGEGRIDETSFEGKVISGVTERARARRLPVYAVAGSAAPRIRASSGLVHIESLIEYARDIGDAKARAGELLVEAGERLGRRIGGAFGPT